ncbi:MAG: hypothetical protein H6766_01270 [Candidatus Peribacteria bacterium]|nr:MAG: hypothetical protein H6766_01270 [Candidatus Peribacteria bacterium]
MRLLHRLTTVDNEVTAVSDVAQRYSTSVQSLLSYLYYPQKSPVYKNHDPFAAHVLEGVISHLVGNDA